MIHARQSVARALVAVAGLVLSAPAAAQTFTFERTYRAPAGTELSVTTDRGRITVHRGDGDQIVVNGRVAVRTGFNVPVKAPEYARATADKPPVQQSGSTVRLETPHDPAVRASVTIEYDVAVPASTRVTAVSQSGAVTITEVGGPISVRTQSSTVAVTHAGSTMQIRTGSGAVTVNGAAGDVQITTESAAIRADEIGGGLTVQTGSGQVEASLVGQGDVDVRTRSSAVNLRGAGGGLIATTESGHITIAGLPRRPWNVTTGSGAIDVAFDSATAAELTASTGGGSVDVAPALADARVKEPRRVAGRVGAGGPAVTLTSRSASIKVSR
jgi:DUF4097 and DUF4098 domain-containing protein YvlB